MGGGGGNPRHVGLSLRRGGMPVSVSTLGGVGSWELIRILCGGMSGLPGTWRGVVRSPTSWRLTVTPAARRDRTVSSCSQQIARNRQSTPGGKCGGGEGGGGRAEWTGKTRNPQMLGNCRSKQGSGTCVSFSFDSFFYNHDLFLNHQDEFSCCRVHCINQKSNDLVRPADECRPWRPEASGRRACGLKNKNRIHRSNNICLCISYCADAHRYNRNLE